MYITLHNKVKFARSALSFHVEINYVGQLTQLFSQCALTHIMMGSLLYLHVATFLSHSCIYVLRKDRSINIVSQVILAIVAKLKAISRKFTLLKGMG